MYELVNTSVPNGLVAGTHGFATVAMTKGMPDAIRTRVENLCAYPHRVSRPDQSYWTENPVNWFHLTLPGGDHVVGRTAPAEFDYTGRTNRISHVLHFRAKEMPQIGGVRILAAEADRLSENWEGEPHYLAEDKATAGQLMMVDSPANVIPSNWVSMFGQKGEELARRFAILLAGNVRGSNRGIYFKASRSDMDGTRLLGLFSDLIDILPVELRAQVTFSTFAPCVPSGAVCHLRGIYDRDAAFDSASTLQPWVDCESCEVKHAELLPNEATPTIDRPSRESLVSAKSQHGQYYRPGQSNFSPRHSNVLSKRNSGGKKSVRTSSLLGGIVAFVAAVGFCCYWWLGQGEQAKATDAITHSDEAIDDRISKWYSEQTNEIVKLQCDLAASTNSQEVAMLLGAAQSFRQQIRKSWKYDVEVVENEKYKEVDTNIARLVLEIKDKKARLDSEEQKNRSIEGDEAPQKVDRKADTNGVASARTKENKAAVEELKMKEKMQKEAAARLADLRNTPLKELKISRHYQPGMNWERVKRELLKEIKDDQKLCFTNKGSVVVWYLFGIKCKKKGYELDVKTGPKQIGGKKGNVSKVDYVFPDFEKEDEIRNSPWVIVHMAGLKSVITVWIWREWPEKKIFDDDKISKEKLIKSCFGDDDAYEVWGSYAKKELCKDSVYFAVTPKDKDYSQYVYYADVVKSGNDVLDELLKLKHKGDKPEPNVNVKTLEANKEDLEKKLKEPAKRIKAAEDGLAKFDQECKELREMTDKVKKECINWNGKEITKEEHQKKKIASVWPGREYKIDYKNDWDGIRSELNKKLEADKMEVERLTEQIRQIDDKVKQIHANAESVREVNLRREKGVLQADIYVVEVLTELPSGRRPGWNAVR